MEYTALWGPKGFIISPTKIVPLLNLSTSFAVKSESGNDTSGAATTNTMGKELQTVSLSTRYVRSAGVDPRGQIAEWEAQVGKAHTLYIQGQRFGPAKLMLKSVDVSNVLLSNSGKFLQVEVALKFEEYTNDSNTSTTATASSATTAAATYNSIVSQKTAALNATASAADKSAKKPVKQATERKMLL